MTDFNKLLRKIENGSHECAVCGMRVALPGVCDRCAAQIAESDSLTKRVDLLSRIPDASRESGLIASKLIGSKASDAAAIARDMIDCKARVCIVMGHAGSGKTTFAAVIGIAITNYGRDLAWYSATQIARAAFEARLGSTPEVIARSLKASVLIIDDLGMEPKGLGEHVYRVIHERHAHAKATVVTTGMNSKQITARYGSGMLRRVTERASVVIMEAKS